MNLETEGNCTAGCFCLVRFCLRLCYLIRRLFIINRGMFSHNYSYLDYRQRIENKPEKQEKIEKHGRTEKKSRKIESVQRQSKKSADTKKLCFLDAGRYSRVIAESIKPYTSLRLYTLYSFETGVGSQCIASTPHGNNRKK